MKLFKITDPLHFPTEDQFFLVLADNHADALDRLRSWGFLLSAGARMLECIESEIWVVNEVVDE